MAEVASLKLSAFLEEEVTTTFKPARLSRLATGQVFLAFSRGIIGRGWKRSPFQLRTASAAGELGILAFDGA